MMLVLKPEFHTVADGKPRVRDVSRDEPQESGLSAYKNNGPQLR